MKGTISTLEHGRGLRLDGEFDLANAPDLAAAIVDLAGDGPADIEMSGVTFMDTAGLHALARCAESLDGDTSLVLVNPPSRIVRLMEMVGVDRMRKIEIRSRTVG